MPDTKFDLIVLGAGPGGYVAAIRAAQLGLKTAIIEKRKTLGGTCLNIGCIPSKALLHSSHQYHFAKEEAASHGIALEGVSVDLPTMLGRKDKVVQQLVGGVGMLVKKNAITRFEGHGKLLGPGTVAVSGEEEALLTAKHVILATGSVPVELPFLPLDGETLVTSEEALAFEKVPEHLLVVGAGAIGLELGSVWSRLGSKVTVVEYLSRIAPGFDEEVATHLQRALKKQGLEFHLGVKVTGVEVENGQATLSGTKGEETVSFTGDKVLVAVGRKPFLENCVDDRVGLELDERGRVKTDAHFKTNIEGVYAIGDIIAGPMLAHKAEDEGVACAERIAGVAGHVNYNTIPGIVYTNPEGASVGLTEEAAKEQGIEVKIGKFPFRANGRALANGDVEGFVKLIADAKTDRLLGGHILSPIASELVPEIVTVMEFEGSAEDIARTVHGHPTLTEALKEAALGVDKRAIHMIN